MNKKQIKILISATPFCENSLRPIKLLRKNNIKFDINLKKRRYTENEIKNLIKSYDGLIADVEPLTSKVLRNAKKLKVISRVGIGLNNIDLSYAKKNKINVFNTPDAPTSAVVEFNIGLIFMLIRKISILNMSIKKGKWLKLIGLRIPFIKIGILGLGRVGFSLANALVKLGVKQIYYNDLKKKITNKKIIYKSKDYIFKNCDLVSINLPETKNTKNFIDKKIFNKMKKNSFLINTSRGEIINENDLYNFLKKVFFAWVALDVFNKEPYYGKLKEFERCILTPHVASHTIDCRNKMEIEATENLIDFFKKIKNN